MQRRVPYLRVNRQTVSLTAFPNRLGECQQSPLANEFCQIVRIREMVAGELLVGPLSVEHDFDAGTMGLTKNAPLGEDRGRTEGLVLMPANVRCARENIFSAWEDIMWRRAAMGDDCIHEWLFVDTLLGVAGGDSVDFGTALTGVDHACHQTDN